MRDFPVITRATATEEEAVIIIRHAWSERVRDLNRLDPPFIIEIQISIDRYEWREK